MHKLQENCFYKNPMMKLIWTNSAFRKKSANYFIFKCSMMLFKSFWLTPNVLLLIRIEGSMKQTTLSISNQLISFISDHTNWLLTLPHFIHFTSTSFSSIFTISPGYQLEENLRTAPQLIIICGFEDHIKTFL